MNEQKQPIQPPRKSKWKVLFGKKWTFPVMYMGAAALILAFIMWTQDAKDLAIDPEFMNSEQSTEVEVPDAGPVNARPMPAETDAIPVTQTEQPTYQWPVAEQTEAVVIKEFYDEQATEELRAAAMVKYQDSYHPHTGVDLAKKDGTTFDVVAVHSGKVTRAEQDPMTGFTIEVAHEDGLQTTYQSLEELQVIVGDEVKKGEFLAKAGRNLFEKDLGIHLHFEAKEQGQTISPDKFLKPAEKEKQAQ